MVMIMQLKFTNQLDLDTRLVLEVQRTLWSCRRPLSVYMEGVNSSDLSGCHSQCVTCVCMCVGRGMRGEGG